MEPGSDLSNLRQPPGHLPFVSVVLPVRNEGRHIRACLQAILAQDYPAGQMEILVVDGLSTDGTRDIVTRLAADDPRIRLLDNPRRIVSTALNIGVRHARGEVIVRVDGHTLLEPDYVSQCVRHLAETGADNVGGPMRPVGTTYVGRAIALATSHPFGVGDSKFHYSQDPQYVDTVYLGAYRREVFERLGSFDEELVRNQDYEFNYRLRQAGGRVFFTPAIRSWYYGRQTLRALASQYFQYGGWKAQVIRQDPASTRPRHLVAPAFALALLLSSALALFGRGLLLTLPFLILILVYGLVSVLFSLSLARQHGWRYLPVLPLVFAILHLSWGLGFWWGLLVSWLPRLRLSAAGRQRALLLGDLVAINLAGLAALWHWTTRSHMYEFNRAFLGTVGVWWLGFFTLLWLALTSVNRFYSLPESAHLRENVQRLGRITAQSLVVYLLIYFFSPRDSLPRLMVLDYGVLSVLFVALWRAVRPFLLVWPKFRHRVVIVGAARRGRATARLIASHLAADYDLVGYLDDDPGLQGQVLADAQVIGTTEALATTDQVQLADVSEVILAGEGPPDPELSTRLMACYARGLPVTPAWQLHETVREHVDLDLVDDWSAVLATASAGGFDLSQVFTRLADVLLAAVGLIPLALVYPVLAWRHRGRPLWVGEELLGRGGQPFSRLRFQIPFGPELWPALVNVLRGEMSLVGPRPMRASEAEALAAELPWFEARHALRPGLTGWAQVHGATGGTLEAARRELGYDLYYLRHRSLTLYLVTLLRALTPGQQRAAQTR